MNKTIKRILEVTSVTAGTLVACGLPYETDTTFYTMKTNKVNRPIRLCVLSDLHNDAANKRKDLLLNKIRKQNPDLILMPGDMFEERRHHDHTFAFLKELVKEYPCYYTTGNHEQFRWDVTDLLQHVSMIGVNLIDNTSTVIECKGQRIELGGIECRWIEEHYDVEEVTSLWKTDYFRILLSHRPHWVDLYSKSQCDLVICGHAHGGQWHIPFFDIPCAAPQQGIFPKYTEGLMDLGRTKMLISRGLVRHYHGIPRLYNNPEIVIMDIRPE